jgi:membrane-associated phospholipid phosphatase
MKTAFRNWLYTAAATVILVAGCIAWVDRPVAEFFDQHVRQTEIWVWVGRALAPLDFVVLAALLFLLGCGTWVLSGRTLPLWSRIPVLCSWAAMWGTAAEVIFKRVFGRGWPEPTYIQDQLYGFHLLHADSEWGSFPSGTATVSCAIVSALWILVPRLRPVLAGIVTLICIGVVVDNFHWVGDVVAGAFLGASIGWMTVRLDRCTDVPVHR